MSWSIEVASPQPKENAVNKIQATAIAYTLNQISRKMERLKRTFFRPYTSLALAQIIENASACKTSNYIRLTDEFTHIRKEIAKHNPGCLAL